MIVRLQHHPDFPSEAVGSLEVEVQRPSAERLALRYHLVGRLSEIILPEQEESVRTDGLWQSSCFEAFLRTDAGPAYREVNLSPSTRWATYEFSAYREGMKAAALRPDPILVARAGDWLTLEAELSPLSSGEWDLALAAVIEERSGRKSYWALAHPPGKPDFHDPDCFVLALPPA